MTKGFYFHFTYYYIYIQLSASFSTQDGLHNIEQYIGLDSQIKTIKIKINTQKCLSSSTEEETSETSEENS